MAESDRPLQRRPSRGGGMNGVHEAAATGDRLKTLRALRDRRAVAIDGGESMRDLAALSRELADVVAQIGALDPPEAEVSPADEVAQRRARRRAGAKSSARAQNSG